MASANIREIAAIAGVSLGTVSNVLNAPEKVGEEKKEKVLAVMAELSYQKPAVKRRGKMTLVGVVTTDIASYIYHPAVVAIEEVLNQNGCHMLLKNAGRNLDKEISCLEAMEDLGVEGVIIISAPEVSQNNHIFRLKERGVPLAVINRHTEDPMVNQVELDAFRGGYAATEHLIKLGHRRIAYMSSPVANRENNGFWRRFRGYQWALEHYGIPFDKRLFAEKEGSKFQAGNALAEELYARLGPANMPTAAFVANDDMAQAAISAWQQKGLRVPEDISVVGFNDQPFSAYYQSGLTTISMPFSEAGRIAANRILEEISGVKGEPLRKVLPCELIPRGTTRPLSDTGVVR